MSVTVGDVYDRIDAFAPFEMQEEWDNAGLLAGSREQTVDSVLCALDLNAGVLREAQEKNVQLIVTHHPILFRGRKNLREDDPEGRLLCELVRSRIALIAAHTNFDNAQPGVNDALAEKLGLTGVEAFEGGLRAGIPAQRTLGDFRRHVEETLGGPVRLYGEPEAEIHKVALLGGAGEDYVADARAAGADVFVTGEIAHHKAWGAYNSGVFVLEAGHAATELPAVHLLAKGLQTTANDVQWNLRIYESETALFK